MSEKDRQRDIFRAVQATVSRDLQRMEDRAMMGMPPLRTFVCQGCGVARPILHGNSVICRCGTTSSAEVLPPA